GVSVKVFLFCRFFFFLPLNKIWKGSHRELHRLNDLFRHGKSFWSRKKTGSIWKFLIPAAIPLLLLGAAGVWFLSGPRTEDQRFRSFTRQLFCQEVGANTLNLHYTLADPAAYGIDSTRISLGTMEQ